MKNQEATIRANCYRIYARKSMESEDRQVLSMPSQIDELKKLASSRAITLTGSPLTEAKTAKKPGRPVFGHLMKEIQAGRIQGVVCWKLDRLARNPVDGGAIIWALDQGKLTEIVTPGRTFTNTSDDKFMMQLEFGMAKKYVDDLSANVQRGMRMKLEMGWLPCRPPIGYMNDPVSRTIIKDAERFDLVQRMWRLLLSGNHSVARIRELANDEWGLKTRLSTRRGGRPLQRSHVYMIFGDPFYAGLIKYGGTIHPGKHPAMVTVQEFQKVQRMLGRPDAPRPKRHDFPFTGVIRCAECGCMVTAEQHRKKSGRTYIYYHCTWRRGDCHQGLVRAEVIEEQISAFMERLHLAKPYCDWLRERLEETAENAARVREVELDALKNEIRTVDRRMGVLTELRVNEEISPEEYRRQYSGLVQDQVRLEQKARAKGESPTNALEPTRQAVSFVELARNAYLAGDNAKKRLILKTVCSNLTLKDKNLLITAKKPFQLMLERSDCPDWCTQQDDGRTFLNDLICACEGVDVGLIEPLLSDGMAS